MTLPVSVETDGYANAFVYLNGRIDEALLVMVRWDEYEIKAAAL